MPAPSALETDVAGIITGYGLSDAMTEAFGGWFAFGAADRIKYTMERFFERLRSAMPAEIGTARSDASPALWFDQSNLPGENGVSRLPEILLAQPPKLGYLIAHSKGSLVVSHALKQYVEDLEGDQSQLFERLRIITLGAVVELPAAFKNVKQYLGALDWFGSANSSLGVTHELVPGTGHHLNPGFPYHMGAASLLKRRSAVVAQASYRGGVCVLVDSANRGDRACAHAHGEGQRRGAGTSEERGEAA